MTLLGGSITGMFNDAAGALNGPAAPTT